MKFPHFSDISVFLKDFFFITYFPPFPFLSLLAFVILSLLSVPSSQYHFPFFSFMNMHFCFPIASICTVRTVSQSFTEEVFTISCSSFFYDFFFHYSFPELCSAKNLNFSFLHGTPMSIFELCHHSSTQYLALYILKLNQCYSFASALSFSGYLHDFYALLNKPISCLIQCQPLAGCITMAFYVSAPTFKLT